MPELDPLRWKALGVVCAAFFMTVLDVSIVNVALPSIGRSLNFSQDALQWVITAYAITFGGFLLLGGRAADLLGRRRVFLVGVVIFTVASFLCGLAPTEGVLIGARALQGFGAAIISPAALSIITTTFEEGPERNKALGIWGAMGGSGAAVGVLAGGVLTKYLGWEWIFYVNVPVGDPGVRARPTLCPREPVGARELARHRRRGHGDERDRAARLRRLDRTEPRLGLVRDDRPVDRLGRAAAGLRVHRVEGEGPTTAVLDLPDPDGRGREHLLVPRRRGDVLELLHPHALRPERPRLLGPEDGPDVRGDRRERSALGRARAGARHEDRREDRARRRLRRLRCRDRPLHAGARERRLRRRPAAGISARRFRAAVHVHPRLDRRARRSRAARGGPRVRPAQHDPAGRRAQSGWRWPRRSRSATSTT